MVLYAGMKKEIHPTFNTKAAIICSCGNTFETGSTMDEIKVEVCSSCHPFYTGKQKFVDTARRVEKFQEREQKVKEAKATRSSASKKAKRKNKDNKKAKQDAKEALKAALKG